MINEAMLITGDLHLTDRPEDAYRWDIFNELEGLCSGYEIDRLVILGDITEKKNNHDAILVNNVTAAFRHLAEQEYPRKIYILKGNHDYVAEDYPFFHFLDKISEKIHFINLQPELIDGMLFLPHTKDPVGRWKSQGIEQYQNKTKMVFLHQEFIYSVRENKTSTTEGIPADYFKDWKVPFISGHMHVSQKVENITYVGSPYHTIFIDYPVYDPRMLLYREGRFFDYFTDYPEKVQLHIRNAEIPKIPKRTNASRVKFKIHMHEGERHRYSELVEKCKRYCEDYGYIFSGTKLIIERSRTRGKERTAVVKDPKDMLKIHCLQEGFRSFYLEKMLELMTNDTIKNT